MYPDRYVIRNIGYTLEYDATKPPFPVKPITNQNKGHRSKLVKLAIDSSKLP